MSEGEWKEFNREQELKEFVLLKWLKNIQVWCSANYTFKK